MYWMLEKSIPILIGNRKQKFLLKIHYKCAVYIFINTLPFDKHCFTNSNPIPLDAPTTKTQDCLPKGFFEGSCVSLCIDPGSALILA